MIPHTLTEKTITFFHGGAPKTFDNSHPKFTEIVQAVLTSNVGDLEFLTEIKKFIAKVTKGSVTITTDDEVYVKSEQVPLYLADRIIMHMKANYPIDSLCAFAEKLISNPNKGVRNDLYKWLEKGQMPIYPDGDFLAYKLVRGDYTPLHAGGLWGQSQKIGEVVTQPRETCDENRGQTCSSGLHFCSYEYLPKFQDMNSSTTGNRVIVLKINPADVVAIPNDYNDTKGRTCRFEVVSEISKEKIKETFGTRLVVGDVGTYKAPTNKYQAADEQDMMEEDAQPKGVRAREAMRKNGDNKTKAAAYLGISRSTLNRWLENVLFAPEAKEEEYVAPFEEGEEMSNLQKAEDAMVDADGNKTKAAAALGISRSTLTRWLNS